jgi:hypothetical protein
MENTQRASDAVQTGALPRVMRELIRTPVLRELLKMNLAESPPGTAAELARAILFEDVDITLSLLGSSPQALNFLTEFLVETGRQFQNFPAEVLQIFIRQMGKRVDMENLQALPGALAPIIDTLIWSDPEALQSLRNGMVGGANAALWASSSTLTRLEAGLAAAPAGRQLDAEAVAELINACARSLGRSMAARPDFLKEVVSRVDRGAVRRAADGAVNALLDARIPIISVIGWACGTVLRRIKRKLKG